MPTATENDTIKDTMDAIELELRKATAAHGAMRTRHEAYGVIAEEFDEFFEEVKKNPAKMTEMQNIVWKNALRKELIQTAAMCARAIVDLGL